MDITIARLLDKMSEEVGKAKQKASSSQQAQVRDQLIAIKTLCELALDQQKGQVQQSVSTPSTQAIQYVQPQMMQPGPSQQEGKKYVSDDANGDSLFDF
ncbi:YwdI family protein [Bacillus sp. CGMCC 1.16541]|uniref:YwdI family protein n=1 Tax=Bacillus sp. CGMCC 1.16541 TaxID=2185143 RepID=UPI000D73C255|nr:YwdI family protein [Bacillus sp. CGMCC 1.16541]